MTSPIPTNTIVKNTSTQVRKVCRLCRRRFTREDRFCDMAPTYELTVIITSRSSTSSSRAHAAQRTGHGNGIHLAAHGLLYTTPVQF